MKNHSSLFKQEPACMNEYMCLNQDDGPRDNASEPEATPIAVHIHNLLIHRQDDGSFSIGGGYSCPLLPVFPLPATSSSPKL